jgi:uncharacterized protein
MDSKPADSGPFHVMIKPIGPVCNLECAYCYYLDKRRLFPGEAHWRMSAETLELLTRQYLAAQPPELSEVVFGWQGGEPTLMGIEFYRQAVELQRKHAPAGMQCVNTIQTNGLLLDHPWCEFLKENGFLVGLSIDGPRDLHDAYRRDPSGDPTFERVANALKLLQTHEVEHNALVVVHRRNADHPRRVYRFLRDSGIEFVQFIPLVEWAPVPDGSGAVASRVSERSVIPAQFGRFLVGVFDEWLRNDVGRVFVQIFDQALSAWMGTEPGLCVFRRECGRAVVLEHNGDVFSCDHFVDEAHRLGNIDETPIGELMDRPEQQEFGRKKRTLLPQGCRECRYLLACNGECPRNRPGRGVTGEASQNYLCEGYRMFFEHADPYLRAMAAEVSSGQPAANVMYRLRANAAAENVSRNAPCPCGSGRKYKHCCMRA